MLKEVSLEIIRKCPNNCLHCSSLSNMRCTEMLPYKVFVDVVSDIARLGAKTICLSGGEPFLHNRIVEMVEFIHSNGLDCYIYTSGISLNAANQVTPLPLHTLEAMASNVTKLIFNIEAATEDTYNKIMGTKGCFSIMQQSVKTAIELGICSEANFVPMAINIQEIVPIIDLCSNLGISKVNFLRLVLHGRAGLNKDKLVLDEESSQKLKHQLAQIQLQQKLNIRIGVPLSLDTSCPICEAANGKLNIRYDGFVFPCEVFKNDCIKGALKGLQPDSIYEKSLFSIYHNSFYLKHIRKLSDDFSKIKTCETCLGQHLINSVEEMDLGE